MSFKPADLRFRLFRDMLLVRRVEEKIAALYPEQDIRCPVHLSIGQEAVSAGVLAAIEPTDYAISAHRSHAHYINKGGDLKAMFAELYGKATGCAKGRGGSMHLIDLAVNFMGCVPIVGATIPIGVGIALGLKMQGSDAVTVVFFGDGAKETGSYHEALNFASLHKLRVLFVCENNGLSVDTPLGERQGIYLSATPTAGMHGIECGQCDGQRVEQVHASVVWALRRMQGPYFLEFLTRRFAQHYGPEYTIDYSRCPIKLYRDVLESDGTMQPEDYIALCHEIDAEIAAALIFAKASPFPVAA
jgi:TPP-dependent pyruvate/acetoin dehydrogenase alpha subunit